MLSRLAGRLRTGDLVTGISRLLALACLVGLVGMLPWLSGKDPALTILRATSSDREPTPEILNSIRKSIGIDGGPLHVIGHWLAGAARGDLGRSWVSGTDVGPDAVAYMTADFSSSGSYSMSGLHDEKVDAAISKAAATQPGDERHKAIMAAEQAILVTGAAIPLAHERVIQGEAAGVTGAQRDPGERALITSATTVKK